MIHQLCLVVVLKVQRSLDARDQHTILIPAAKRRRVRNRKAERGPIGLGHVADGVATNGGKIRLASIVRVKDIVDANIRPRQRLDLGDQLSLAASDDLQISNQRINQTLSPAFRRWRNL